MYAKIFAQMYDGTLCTAGPWQALVTFQQLLILADKDGNVDMTMPAISRRTTIPLEIIEIGIAALLLPDSDSRTPDEGGRRIVPLSDGRAWGWRIVNYQHYRELKREEDRREYHRTYWKARKQKETQHAQQTQHNSTNSTKSTEAYAEAYAEAKNRKASMSGKPDALPLKAIARDLLGFLNLKAGRAYRPTATNIGFIVARLKDGASESDCRVVIAKKCREWSGDQKMNLYLRPATLFNRTKFDQYIGECVTKDSDDVA